MKIYVGATRQNQGKTITCLGLLNTFLKRFHSVGYIKPVGQQFSIVDGEEVDKDVILMKSVYKLKENLKDMSPIAVPKGFTEDYILKGNKEELRKRVIESYQRVSKDKNMVVIANLIHSMCISMGAILGRRYSKQNSYIRNRWNYFNCYNFNVNRKYESYESERKRV